MVRTPLVLAAMGGHASTVKLLLAKGAVVNFKDKKDQSALLHAVELNHYSVVQILVDRISATQGADVFVPSMREAVVNGHDRIVKLLLDRGVSTETKMTERGETTLLYEAVKRKLASTVYLLLENGALVFHDSKDFAEWVVGLQDGFSKDYISALRIIFAELASQGVDLKVEEKDTRLYQLMEFLLREESVGRRRTPSKALIHDIVQILFVKDTKVQELQNISYPLLLFATERGHTSIVEILLDNGVNPGKDEEDTRPLWIAVAYGDPLVVQMFLEKGSNPDGRWLEETPLLEAASKGNTAIARILLEHGASPDGQESDVPLSAAAMRGYTPVVKLLLECGADPDKTSMKYMFATPLSLAARNGFICIVQLLLGYGAKIEGSDRGKRPLAHAIDHGYEPIVKLLIERGARMTRSQKLLRMSSIWAPPRRKMPLPHAYNCYCNGHW